MTFFTKRRLICAGVGLITGAILGYINYLFLFSLPHRTIGVFDVSPWAMGVIGLMKFAFYGSIAGIYVASAKSLKKAFLYAAALGLCDTVFYLIKTTPSAYFYDTGYIDKERLFYDVLEIALAFTTLIAVAALIYWHKRKYNSLLPSNESTS